MTSRSPSSGRIFRTESGLAPRRILRVLASRMLVTRLGWRKVSANGVPLGEVAGKTGATAGARFRLVLLFNTLRINARVLRAGLRPQPVTAAGGGASRRRGGASGAVLLLLGAAGGGGVLAALDD